MLKEKDELAGDGIFPFLCLDQIPGIELRQQKGKLEVITSFVVYVRIMVYVYFGPWMYFIIDPICCKFCMVLSMFFVDDFGKSFRFSIRDIDLTLGLLAFRRQVVWRDSVAEHSFAGGQR